MGYNTLQTTTFALNKIAQDVIKQKMGDEMIRQQSKEECWVEIKRKQYEVNKS